MKPVIGPKLVFSLAGLAIAGGVLFMAALDGSPRMAEIKSALPPRPAASDADVEAIEEQLLIMPSDTQAASASSTRKKTQGITTLSASEFPGPDMEPMMMPAPAGEPTTDAAQRATVISASYLFAGPNEIPPDGFLAYGMLIFTTRPQGDLAVRGRMFCQAFVNSIPHTSNLFRDPELEVPEVVTIWPVQSAFAASTANTAPDTEKCETAVPFYGLSEALRHRTLAERSEGFELPATAGPFLIAWAPGETRGTPQAKPLLADLSDVTNPSAAREAFARWVRQIERREDYWLGLPWHERLRRTLRNAADTNGPAIRQGVDWLLRAGKEESENA
ncbi:hypothetical protein Q4543_05710 [Salipiger sp. 1_MG-2023]|uniref:hypothetical protein n=1 Tax=Salipiger sp. 1_MG-2023 TaxID=3062665 RepID=UPI0026E32F44|nr:hypothetical protein [Salipiger sp. 1_MG-2023]MDO6585007.1 hypothetical protein [Salipiger sp. 1_MG-2023]